MDENPVSCLLTLTSVLSQYSAHAAYCHSKLAQVLFSSRLHQEMQSGGFHVSSCAVDPGIVDTALYRHLWTPLHLAQSAIARLLFRVSLTASQRALIGSFNVRLVVSFLWRKGS